MQETRYEGSVPGLERSPGRGHGNPLQCSCLENSMGRGTGWAAIHGAAKSWMQLSTHTNKNLEFWRVMVAGAVGLAGAGMKLAHTEGKMVTDENLHSSKCYILRGRLCWENPSWPGNLQGNLSAPPMRACSVASVVSDSSTPWMIACQAPLSMGVFWQEYWSGLPRSSPGDLPNPGIEPPYPTSPALQTDSSLLSHQGSPLLPYSGIKIIVVIIISILIMVMIIAFPDTLK